jgi:hypothetical protein
MTRMASGLLLLLLVIGILTISANSQSTCTVDPNLEAPSCLASDGWSPGVTCGRKTVDCSTSSPPVSALSLTYGVLTPASPHGTIVLFSDSGGTDPSAEAQFGTAYYNAGYQVVETAWDSDWEDTGNTPKSIAYAAGRPAAFLNWVRYGSSLGGPAIWTSGGMCVHGVSAGAAVGAYALAWYGGGSYIDKLSALSGPPLSDIYQGCVKPLSLAPPVEVCPPSQLGCNSTNSPANWTQDPKYSDALSGVREWTGDTVATDQGACLTTNPLGTSSTANAAWKAMSIVDGTVGVFNYPNTNMTAWLCAPPLASGVMNNSSPQAQLFFSQFNSSSLYEGLTINAATNCDGDEGVASLYSVPPSSYIALGYTYGTSAIIYDMTEDPVNACMSHHP